MTSKHPNDISEAETSVNKKQLLDTVDPPQSAEPENQLSAIQDLETSVPSMNQALTSIQTPKAQINKEAFNFFETALLGSKHFLAPMVDQSELAWRILSRRYGAQVCFTPMFHAKMFSDESNRGYFNEMWQTNKQDRPLVVQFCANEPESFLAAAKLVEDSADAVDLNLGCPQHIARRGKYGAYLMDEWDLIYNIVNNASKNLKIPVTVKIRIYPEVEKTIKYAQMLEKAGAKMLTVHGRLREQKGHKTGLCDWAKIKAVRESVSVPVVANGGILYFEDIDRCIEETGVQAVMVAEPNLYNPAFFTDKVTNSYDIASEYLEICKIVPTKPSYIRAHMFKLFKPALPKHTDLRTELALAKSIDEFSSCIEKIKQALLEDAKSSEFDPQDIKVDEFGYKVYPHWVCQPLIRMEFDAEKSKGDKPLGRTIS